MATSKDIQEKFHKAVLDAYERHGFKSYRHAEQVTGVNYSTIYAIVSRGRIPTRGQVIEWAEGLNEPINKWLELSGYNLIETTIWENTCPVEVISPPSLPDYMLTNLHKHKNSRHSTKEEIDEAERKIIEEFDIMRKEQNY